MKSIIALLCTLLLVSSFNLQQTSQSVLSFKPSNLGFGGSRGSGFTQAMYNDAVNFINAASGFYRDDVLQNMIYIKRGLDNKYSQTGNEQFYVYIQTSPQPVYTWYVYLNSNQVWSEFSGINIVKPDWSYFIYKNVATSDSTFTHLMPWTAGTGITDELRKTINTIVNDNEPNGECYCSSPVTQAIGNELISRTGLRWNTVCDEHGITQAYVKTVNGYWGTFQPKNCFYTLFVHL